MQVPIDTKTVIRKSGIEDLPTAKDALSWYLPPPLLAEEFGIRFLEEAGDLLEDYVLPESLEEALDYLAYLSSLLTLLDLYQHYFPEEFAHSTKNIIPAKDRAYSEREFEFFELLNNRLIFLPWHMVDDIGAREDREPGFPLIAMGREWWNDDLSEWEPGWLLLLWMTGDFSPERVMQEKQGHHLDPAIFELPIKHGERFAIEALQLHCRRKLTGPIVNLPIALKILWHDTGCWYLDVSSEDYGNFFAWDTEDIDLHIKQRELFERLTDQADELIKWIDSDPLNNMKEVIHLWNLYILDKQDKHMLLIDCPPQS